MTQPTTEGPIVLADIPVKLDEEKVLERLRWRSENSRIRGIIRELIGLAEATARPKAIYRVSCARTIDRKTLEVDGVEFTSYIPTLDFGDGERVFAYVATCGREVDALEVPRSDFMKHFCLNITKEMVLRVASEYLREHLLKEYGLTEMTRVGPGEALGPISQQRQLFSVIGDVEGAIGVTLSAHNMMVPEKSSSGIFFETAVKMESCQLCPDTKCRGRRAPYQPELVRQHHGR